MIKNKRALATGIASVAMSLSLVACTESSLQAKVRKDGSIDIIATGQVTQEKLAAQGGIAVDENQGISVDPSAMEEGSMHIRIILPDGEKNPSGVTDAKDETSKEKDATSKSSGHGGRSESDADTKEQVDKSASDDATGSDELSDDADYEPAMSDEDGVSGDTKPEGVDSADSDSEDSTESGSDGEINGKVVFERTLSSMDAVNGLITVSDLDEGYYLVYVSAEHATGTVKVRSYDLSRKEIRDRDSQRAVDKAKEIIDTLFGEEAFNDEALEGLTEYDEGTIGGKTVSG